MTKNFGLKKGELNALKHVERLRPGKDGYVQMDKYNRPFAVVIDPRYKKS